MKYWVQSVGALDKDFKMWPFRSYHCYFQAAVHSICLRRILKFFPVVVSPYVIVKVRVSVSVVPNSVYTKEELKLDIPKIFLLTVVSCISSTDGWGIFSGWS